MITYAFVSAGRMLLPLLALPLLALLPLPGLGGGIRLVIALALSTVGLLHGALLLVLFDPALSGFQFVTAGVIGVDGLSLLLALLTALLMPIALLSLGRSRMLLAIGLGSLAAFVALDLLLFYIAPSATKYYSGLALLLPLQRSRSGRTRSWCSTS